MTYIEIFILTLFDILMLISVIQSFEVEQLTLKKTLIIIPSVTIINSSLFYIIEFEPIAVTLSIVFVLLLLKMLSKKPLEELVVIYCFSLIIIYCIQFLTTTFLSFFFNNFGYHYLNGVASQIISLVLIIILIKILPIKSIYYYIMDRNRWFIIIIIDLFIMYYILMILWFIDISSFLELSIVLLLLVSTTLCINIVIIKNGLQNQSLKEQVMIYNKYISIIEELIEDIKLKQHDFHNHIQVMETLQSDNIYGIKDIDDYMLSLKNQGIWTKLIFMNNKVLIAFFYCKYNDGLSRGIEINYIIHNYFIETQFTDYELIDLYGVLIDNALEETEKSNGNSIDVIINKQKGLNLFETKNKCRFISSYELQNMFKYKYTTKKGDDHGLGLYKAKKLLEKRKGTITVHYDTQESIITFSIKHN